MGAYYTVKSYGATSIVAYRYLLKHRIDKYSKSKLFRLGYTASTKRTQERDLIVNEMELYLQWLFRILNSPDYDKQTREYARKKAEEFKRELEKTKDLKISAKELNDFKEKLEKIREIIRKTDEIYPLSIYLDSILKIYPEIIKLDQKLLENLEEEKYLELVEEGFEKFPEKTIVFQAPIIALYLAFGGYERMNTIQIARLTAIFHHAVRILTTISYEGIIELGDSIRKIPTLARR